MRRDNSLSDMKDCNYQTNMSVNLAVFVVASVFTSLLVALLQERCSPSPRGECSTFLVDTYVDLSGLSSPVSFSIKASKRTLISWKKDRDLTH